jgi:AcrR family transcriptional regulator
MSPRTEESNARIREEQRGHILDAAIKVFARKGFTDTKMSDIAAEAKISYGLAYHYFANKEAIFNALLEKALQGSLDLMRYARMQPGTPWDRLRWLMTKILEGGQEEPEYEMVVLQALTNVTVPEEIHNMVMRESKASHEALKQLVLDGQAAGQVIPEDPDQLTTALEWCIQGMVFGLSYWDDTAGKPARQPDADMVLRLLKP